MGSDGKGKERHLPSSPTHFLFFDYCYFYLDTQWEPLQRRESQRPLFAFAINLNRVTHAEVSNVDHNLVFSTVIISCSKVVLSRLCLATFGVWSNFLWSLGLLFLLLLFLLLLPLSSLSPSPSPSPSSSLFARTTQIVFAGQQTHCFQLETELPSKLRPTQGRKT